MSFSPGWATYTGGSLALTADTNDGDVLISSFSCCVGGLFRLRSLGAGGVILKTKMEEACVCSDTQFAQFQECVDVIVMAACGCNYYECCLKLSTSTTDWY